MKYIPSSGVLRQGPVDWNSLLHGVLNLLFSSCSFRRELKTALITRYQCTQHNTAEMLHDIAVMGSG